MVDCGGPATPMTPRSTLSALLLAAAAFAQAKPELPPAPALGKDTTEALCARFTTADHWVQKAVVLLSLNQWWHPAGVSMVLEALRAKDLRLCAFGVETLLRSDPALLPTLATPELLDELIVRQLARSNDLLRSRVLEALARLVPKAGAGDRAAFTKWWSGNKEIHQPEPWSPRSDSAAAAGGGTTAAAQRAFDLYQSGLDMMLCIDSTGSMQPTIDALGAALGQMVDILDGLSPKLRLGLVHYRDYGELGKPGAKVLLPFTKNVTSVQKALGDLRADGGGDLPEAVLGGLATALDEKNGWKKDANRIVVLIGDAPPHDDDRQRVLEWARLAFESPGSVPGKPVTGKPDGKPFLTSAIGVFLDLPDSFRGKPGVREFLDSQQQMRTDFQAIAKAGGGVFVEVTFQVTDGPGPVKSKEREQAQKKEDAVAAQATRRIVEHILVLSFGERFRREMHDFVRVFYEYKEAGFFK